ncbi:MAG TPA: family 43 glycosylhydrolase [Polyangiales bacterium]
MLEQSYLLRSAALASLLLTANGCEPLEPVSSDPLDPDQAPAPNASRSLDATTSDGGLDAARTRDAWPSVDDALLASDAAADAALDAQVADATLSRDAPCIPTADHFERIFSPSQGRLWPWYYNDHTFIRDRAGLWHLFGITRPEPAIPHWEREFGHATSPSLTSDTWARESSALVADTDSGETLLWAPHVIEVEGTYYMFYCAGGEPESFQIKLATSTDLRSWTRVPEPLFRDGVEARDPFVIRVGPRWVMYYTANSEPSGGNHVVAYRVSDDLRHWSDRKIAFTDPSTGTVAGPTESPFVVARPEGYYLFIGPRNDYVSTEVFFSRDPFHFEPTPIAAIEAHAPEVIIDVDGSWHISHAGWGEGGVYLSPLAWNCDGKPAR